MLANSGEESLKSAARCACDLWTLWGDVSELKLV